MFESLDVIAAILGVGIALAALILRGQQNTNRRIDATNQRIDALNNRIMAVEKGQSRLEGCLAGLLHPAPPPAA